MIEQAEKRRGRPPKNFQPDPVTEEVPQEQTVPFDVTTPVTHEVRRVLGGDIDRLSGWLYPRIKYRWPHIRQTHLGSWLQGFLNDNTFSVIRTDHAVGMAQILNDPLSPITYVMEIFVYAEPEFEAECVSISKHFLWWSQQNKGARFEFGEDNDAPISSLVDALGRKRNRSVYYIDLE